MHQCHIDNNLFYEAACFCLGVLFSFIIYIYMHIRMYMYIYVCVFCGRWAEPGRDIQPVGTAGTCVTQH